MHESLQKQREFQAKNSHAKSKTRRARSSYIEVNMIW